MPRPPLLENIPPPQVGYGSWITFLDHLNTFGEPPNIINNRIFPSSFSGTTIALTLRALRFFDLTDDDGKPDEERLRPLMHPETRQNAMVGFLEEKYPGLFALPLSKAGPGEIRDYFADLISDPTAARKARSFFIQAAKANGISIHGSVEKSTRTRSKPGKRRVREKVQNETNGASGEEGSPQRGDRSTKTINLRTGNGIITLSVAFDAMTLSTADRNFIFGIIDRLNAYSTKKSTESGDGE